MVMSITQFFGFALAVLSALSLLGRLSNRFAHEGRPSSLVRARHADAELDRNTHLYDLSCRRAASAAWLRDQRSADDATTYFDAHCLTASPFDSRTSTCASRVDYDAGDWRWCASVLPRGHDATTRAWPRCAPTWGTNADARDALAARLTQGRRSPATAEPALGGRRAS